MPKAELAFGADRQQTKQPAPRRVEPRQPQEIARIRRAYGPCSAGLSGQFDRRGGHTSPPPPGKAGATAQCKRPGQDSTK